MAKIREMCYSIDRGDENVKTKNRKKDVRMEK